MKNKEKILKVYEAGHGKRQRLKTAEFQNMDAATYNFFLSKRCENAPITGLNVQTHTSFWHSTYPSSNHLGH